MSEHKDRGLTEDQARRSETELMVGRLAGLARSNTLTADQRIGVCFAQKVLEERRRELNARRNAATECDHGYPPATTGRPRDGTCPSCGKTRVTPPGEGLPDCEGWTCQSCGADNFIPAGFARVAPPGESS